MDGIRKLDYTLFPLTPALSPRERVSRPPVLGSAVIAAPTWNNTNLRKLFPLP